MNNNLIDYWDFIALHIWLIFSSFGIIYAILSFFQDLHLLNNLNDVYYKKGLISFFVGLVFYVFIGLRHLEGAKKK